jgi:hypothetical protein
MEDRDPPADTSSATYEIRLQGAPPEQLERRFPAVTMFTTPTETVFFRSIENASELDALLDQLMSMGLVLTEVHEVPLADTSIPEHGSVSERKAAHDDQSL